MQSASWRDVRRVRFKRGQRGSMSSPMNLLLGFAALLVGLLCSVALAQSTDTSRRGLLYEIRKGNQVALLMGTIHVGRPEFYPLPQSQLARIDKVDAIVLEADIADTARAIAATQKYAMYAPGEPGLDTRLPPALK